MGIKQLSAVIKNNCKLGYKERSIEYFAYKKVAIDISSFIYQFLIAVRSGGNALGVGDVTTSHLVGLFYRTIRIVEAGIIPIFVFDGKPPKLKMYELKKRAERREKALEDLKLAIENEDKAEIERQNKRNVRVTEEYVDDCKRLLKLMGMPYMTAPSEAEAFCAYLCKKKKVFAVATEDMDALPFGAPILIRNFSSAAVKKTPVCEYNLERCLKELDLKLSEFIDLCILLGCDYTESAKNIGIKRGVSLIKEYRTIENIFDNGKMEDKETFEYKEAREIFNTLSSIEVDVEDKDLEIAWENINVKEVKTFLVDEKNFDERRVINGVDTLLRCKARFNQSNLDRFIKRK